MNDNDRSSGSVQSVAIGDIAIPVVEYRGERVVTFAMVDQVHQRPKGTAKDRFSKNRDRFVEGEDFYLVDFSKRYEFHTFGIDIPSRGLTVLTESGYLMITKSLTDDRAWQVQRHLVRTYFKSKNLLTQVRREMERIQEHTIQTTAEIVFDRMQKHILELEIRLDRRTAAVDHMSAKQVLDQEKVPSKKRRGLVIKVSSRLRSFCSELDVVALRSAETGTWLFPIHVIKQWMKVEGSTLISGHLAALYGQLEMVFDDKHMDEQNKTSVGTPVQTTH